MVCVSVPVATDAALTAGTAAEAAGAAGVGADALGAGAGLDALGTSAAYDAAGSGLDALGSGIGANALSGAPLDALFSGITAGASDVTPAIADTGISGLAGIGGNAAATDAAANAASGAGGFIGSMDGTAPLVDGSASALGSVGGISPAVNTAAQAGTALNTAVQANAASGAGGIGSYLGKQNPLSLALAGSTGLSAIQALMPKKKVNTGQNAADVLSTNPSFSNPNLPKYTMQNTATPYTGNWYTYGQQPEAPMYNAMPTPAAKRGGLMRGYAQGGSVQTINPTYAPASTYTARPSFFGGPITYTSPNGIGSLTAQQYANEVAFEANGGNNSSANSQSAAPLAPPIGPAPTLNMNNIAPSAPSAALPPPTQQSINPLQMLNTPQNIPQSQMPMQSQGIPQNQAGGVSFAQAFGPIQQAMQQQQPQYARGGHVKGYAMGGPIPAPMGAAAAPMAQPSMPPQAPQSQKQNPLAMSKAAFNIGHAIGQHIKKTRGTTPDGRVHGPGTGQNDMIPAKLSKDEYVLSADIPAALGDGSSEAGGKVLDKFVQNVRQHKTKNGSKFPPKAKNPLAYLPKGKA